jgi:NADPH-dependent curcumin reductase CurA
VPIHIIFTLTSSKNPPVHAKMVANKAFIYKAVPHGWPVPGQDLAVETSEFDLDAAPPKGGVTTKNFYAAFDPSQRGRMRDPKIWSYSPAMEVGKPVLSVSVIGKVLRSDNSNFKEGSIIMLPYGTESYSAIPESDLKSAVLLDPPKGLPLTAYLGALGMTGMTAYGSLMEIGQPKKGETIWVSGAAGAVGQMQVCTTVGLCNDH